MFEKGCNLHYCSPSHGGWGVVRMGMLVPESYQLFVCPFACGRHGAIGAIKQGYKDRLSYLYIDETDIVSGSYEDLIVEACAELLEVLEPCPKVLMIFVSCLDDLLVTDHEAFLSRLREKHPEVKFTVCHMNPISLDSEIPPSVNIQCKMFGLLDSSTSAKVPETMAFYGNNVPLDPAGEIFAFLKAAGFSRFLHIAEAESFKAFQEMAEVKLNLVVNPIGLRAARENKNRLGIDYLYLPQSYQFSEIIASYRELMEKMFSVPDTAFDFSSYKRETEAELYLALSALGQLPIIIDSSATVRPFSLARLLLDYGFNVIEVFAEECPEREQEHFAWLQENAPLLKFTQPEHPRSPLIRQEPQDILAIGFEGAYLTGAKYIVDLVADETLYGFHGIGKLARLLISAAEKRVELEDLLNDYGLVV